MRHNNVRFVQRIFRLFFVIFVFLFYALPAKAQVPDLEKLDRYVEQTVRDWGTPGLAVAVLKDDKVVFAKGYGVRELGKPGKVDEHTLFAVASNTKAFTATLLGMLIEEERLTWDTRVVDLMNDFQMYDPYVTREMTVRDLLTHRSGLATFGGDHLWIGNDLSRDEIIYRIRYLVPTASFRYKYQYNNLMFLTAGELVPRIIGKSWDEFLNDRILGPLGMDESNTSVRSFRNFGNVAQPHEYVNGSLVPIEYDNVDALAPAGGINSNVLDMAKWMRFNLGNGNFGGKQLIDRDILREIHTVQFANYGLGWGIGRHNGKKLIRHGGGLSGMISAQAMIPEDNLGVIVLSNIAPDSPTSAIANRVLDVFMGAPERDWSAEGLERIRQKYERLQKAEEELYAKRVQGTKPSLNLEHYTGAYHDDLSGNAEVRLENGKLVFDYNPRHIGDLEHWNYDTFRITWRHQIYDMPSKVFITFYLDEFGEVEKLKTQYYDPIFFDRVKK